MLLLGAFLGCSGADGDKAPEPGDSGEHPSAEDVVWAGSPIDRSSGCVWLRIQASHEDAAALVLDVPLSAEQQSARQDFSVDLTLDGTEASLLLILDGSVHTEGDFPTCANPGEPSQYEDPGSWWQAHSGTVHLDVTYREDFENDVCIGTEVLYDASATITDAEFDSLNGDSVLRTPSTFGPYTGIVGWTPCDG